MGNTDAMDLHRLRQHLAHLDRGLGLLVARLMDRPAGRRTLGSLMVLALIWAVLAFLAPVAVLVLFVAGSNPEALPLLITLTVGLWLAGLAMILWARSIQSGLLGYSRGVKRTMDAAQAGDPEAMWRMVDLCRKGLPGMGRDGAQAAWWLRKLAESGDRAAMLELAQVLERGEGVLKDRVQAEAWRRRAQASQG